MNIFPQDSPARFSLANFNALAEASELAYGDPTKVELDVQYIRAVMVTACIEGQVITDDLCGTTTLCFIAKTAKQIIVSFQGTKDEQEMFTDINAWLEKRHKYKVHSGFNHALDTVWEKIIRTLLKMRDMEQEIWVTGHSLGGALAALFALRCYEASIPITGVYTFGQPRCFNRIGGRIYSRALGSVTYRCRDKADGVPLLPPRFNGYGDTSHFVYWDVMGKIHLKWPWYFILGSDLADIFLEWNLHRKAASLADHGIANYRLLGRITASH